MRILILFLSLLVSGCAGFADTREREAVKVYEAGNPVLPKYIIRDGKVYEAGKPVLPVGEVKE